SMQFPEKWLRELVDPELGSDGLAHLLTMAGLEVEEWRPVSPPFSGVVVGEVLAVENHPGANKLKVCRTNVGASQPVSIVCGAPNVVAGMKAPCALVGAKLPQSVAGQSLEIKVSIVRGVESHGMLCSARELGLSEDHSGLLTLRQDAPVGTNVRDLLDLNDHIFTVKLTPNRPDCLSVLGMAREVAALTRAPLRAPDIYAVPKVSEAAFPVKISAPDGCGRFTGRVIRNVNENAPSPEWMKRRLERAG